MTFCSLWLQIPRCLCHKLPKWCQTATFPQNQFLTGFKEWKRWNIFPGRSHSQVSAKPMLCLTLRCLGYTVLKPQQLLKGMLEDKWDLLPHDLYYTFHLQTSATCSASDGKCLQSSSVEVINWWLITWGDHRSLWICIWLKHQWDFSSICHWKPPQKEEELSHLVKVNCGVFPSVQQGHKVHSPQSQILSLSGLHPI